MKQILCEAPEFGPRRVPLKARLFQLSWLSLPAVDLTICSAYHAVLQAGGQLTWLKNPEGGALQKARHTSLKGRQGSIQKTLVYIDTDCEETRNELKQRGKKGT